MNLYISIVLKLGFGSITRTGPITGQKSIQAKKQIKLKRLKEAMRNVKSTPER